MTLNRHWQLLDTRGESAGWGGGLARHVNFPIFSLQCDKTTVLQARNA
jgi:hypothetical protein